MPELKKESSNEYKIEKLKEGKGEKETRGQ
jgi:hypothetical protein